MHKLYYEKRYGEEELRAAKRFYGVDLDEKTAKAANEFFSVFYNAVRAIPTDLRGYGEGYDLDVFPTDEDVTIKGIAGKYADCELPETTSERDDMTLDEFFARVCPEFTPEARAGIVASFKKQFAIGADEEPIAVLETGLFDSTKTLPFYILVNLWIAKFKTHTLFIALGSDE